MPQRSKVARLPDEVRQALDRQMIAAGFGGYVALSEWLAERGFTIGKSALAEHGAQLERRIEALRLATEQAEALVAAAPDDSGAVADASIRLAQERIFELLLAAESGDLKELAGAARALAETARAGTAIRAERRKALAAAAERAGKVARKAGVSPDTAAAIRAAIAGTPADAAA